MMKSPEQRARERKEREERKEKEGEKYKEQREEDNNLLTYEVKLLFEEYLRKNDFYNP